MTRLTPVFLLLPLLLLTACGTSKPTRVLLIGGAGLSQLGDLGAALSAVCPDADIVETGGWDGFRANAAQIATADPPPDAVVLIAHSFGCQTAADAAAQLTSVDLLVLIDPAWDDITVPRSVHSTIWYQRAQDLGLERRANVRNAGRPIPIAADHAGICHDDHLIAEISAIVRRISERHALLHRLRTLH